MDVGKTTTQRNDTSKLPFFERAKICTEKILQRKIFSKPKDEIGLILMGTDSTHNNLNSTLGGYENISEAFDVATTNWQMLKILDKEISQNKSDADWLDAIIVAMDFMKTQTTYVNVDFIFFVFIEIICFVFFFLTVERNLVHEKFV